MKIETTPCIILWLQRISLGDKERARLAPENLQRERRKREGRTVAGIHRRLCSPLPRAFSLTKLHFPAHFPFSLFPSMFHRSDKARVCD